MKSRAIPQFDSNFGFGFGFGLDFSLNFGLNFGFKKVSDGEIVEEDITLSAGFTYTGDPGAIVTSTLLETVNVSITLVSQDGETWGYEILFPGYMLQFLQQGRHHSWLTTPIVYGNVRYDSEAEANGAAQDKAIETVKEYQLWLEGKPYVYTYPMKIPLRRPRGL